MSARASLLVIAAALLSTSAFAAPRTFVLDGGTSEVFIQTFREGPAARLAHDHVVVARDVTGRVEVDADAPERSTVVVSVATGSLVVDEPAARRRFKLDGDLTAEDRATVTENMKGDSQLDVERFPVVGFKATAVKPSTKAGSNWIVVGDFTLHGVTRSIEVPMNVVVTGDRLKATGSFTILTKNHGIAPYQAMLGAIRNRGDVVVHLVLDATAR